MNKKIMLSVALVCVATTAQAEISVPAQVVSLHDSKVTALLAADVVAVKAEVGDFVKKGQVLARLDCRDFKLTQAQAKAAVMEQNAKLLAANIEITTRKANVATSRADIKAAQAKIRAAQANQQAVQADIKAAQSRFTLAKREFNRQQSLHQQRLISSTQFDNARTTLDAAQADFSAVRSRVGALQGEVQAAQAVSHAAQAKAEAVAVQVDAAKADIEVAQAKLNALQANKELADLNVSRCRIVSPFNGQITQRFLQIGQRLSLGGGAFQVLSHKDLEVSASFSQDELKQLRKAKSILFEVDEKRYTLKQRAVMQQVQGEIRSQEVRFSFKRASDFAIGQYGRIIFK